MAHDEHEDPPTDVVVLGDEEQDTLWCDERERPPGRPEDISRLSARRTRRASTGS